MSFHLWVLNGTLADDADKLNVSHQPKMQMRKVESRKTTEQPFMKLQHLFILHFGWYFSVLNLRLWWGPAHIRTSLQPVHPTEEGTARSHTWQGLDCRVGGKTLDVLFMKVQNCCLCFVGTGIVVVAENILGTSCWTLIFHLLDNFGQICLVQ